MKIFQLFLRGEEWFDFVPKRIGFFDEFLRLFAAVPEIVSRHQGVEFAQALLRARYVKETSADEQAYRWQSSIPL